MELATSLTFPVSLLTNASVHCQVGTEDRIHLGKKGPLVELFKKMKYL